ncbi:hypothetical protein [Hymenobacter latericus]|uniref:hypothetical protein n=1 Tax=Hymenobacter sp. YIM 151858-1 TaxID=2987688 RepID=UPI002226BE47|nr:hypothetical protein [Hymenobacter sp. YIM 151858-1]UYZ57554.1 hypothetical protein OIS50_10780 [Hymenobacter sp. YIM 151858-1]
MNYLIYLAQGPAALRCEALYSVLSYFRVAPQPPAQVLIYTDDAAAFRQVLGPRPDVHYPAVSAEEWQAWRGKADMVYMVKIGVLEHAAVHYPGNLLLIDTDTIWQQDPTPLFSQIGQGQRFLHATEGRLGYGDALNRKVYRNLTGHPYRFGNTPVQITPETVMLNSGAVGLSSHDLPLLHDVRELAEQFYAVYRKHLMEQLAFSVRLPLAGPVQEAAPYVLHYWNLKGVRPTLVALFEKYAGASHEELLRRLDALNLPEVHRSELAYRNLAGWQRTLRKLMGKRWRMPAFEV